THAGHVKCRAIGLNRQMLHFLPRFLLPGARHGFLGPAPCLPRRPRLEHAPTEGRIRPVMAPGEVAEWSNAPHSKCGIGASLSGVRIPPSPPALKSFFPCKLSKPPANARSNNEDWTAAGQMAQKESQARNAGLSRRHDRLLWS